MAVFLETQRLIFKTPSPKDISNWVALHRVWKNYKPATIKEWLESDIAHFKKHGFGMGSIYEKNSKAFIGRAGLVYLNHDDTQPDIEVGYVIHKIYWNKGYATELATAIIGWGFKNLSTNKLVAITPPHNKSSQRVLEKSGMRFTKKVQLDGENYLFYEIYKQNK